MKAFFLVAVILLVILAAFAIANAVFSSDEQQSFSTQKISDSLNTGASSVGSGMNDANNSADSWGFTADDKATQAGNDAFDDANTAASLVTLPQ